ncbi:neural cell adhesion molecule 1 [Pieris brassicae]|uniref:neural cell adhesion molecule 1 n=1 Tax=Pieris brassicae TaxID=7116 RepID=UPI001E661E9B|nr:neural cell adhesion molecule 1 [Pieris brassicae]
MRWTAVAFFLNVIYSVLSTSPNDGEPYLHVMARPSVYNAGVKRAIYCKGQNMPELIDWLSPNGDVVEGRSTKNTRVYVERSKNDSLVSSLVALIIQETMIEDTGNWTCRAGSLNETIEITVGVKAMIPNKYEIIEGEEGKSVKFDCVAKGHPAPIVQWYIENDPITNDPKKYIIRVKADNHQLEIRNLTHRDTNEYVCRVTQKALSHFADKRVQLNVNHKPFLVDENNEVSYSKYKAEEVYAIINETKNITCIVIANPLPTFRWYRTENGFDELITDPDTVMTSEDGNSSVFILRTFDETAFGQYKCSANNSKGQVTILYDVSPGNKPNSPDFVELVSKSKTELTFNVTCSTCNMATTEEDMSEDPKNLTVLGYSFQVVAEQEGFLADWDAAVEFIKDIKEFNDTLFTLGPLANDTTYHVRVRTRNAAGFSEWVKVTPNPTTDFANRLAISSILLIICFLYPLIN